MAILRAVRRLSVLASVAIAVGAIVALVNGAWGWLIAAVIAEIVSVYVGSAAHFRILMSGVSAVSDLMADAHWWFVDMRDASAALARSRVALSELDKHERHNPKELAQLRLFALTQHAVLLAATGALAEARAAVNGAADVVSAGRVAEMDCAKRLAVELRGSSPRLDAIGALYEEMAGHYGLRIVRR